MTMFVIKMWSFHGDLVIDSCW